MKKLLLKILSAALAAVLLLGVVSCKKDPVVPPAASDSVPAEVTPVPTPEPTPLPIRPHKDVTYDEMVFSMPDTDAVAASIDALFERLDAGEGFDTLLPDYDRVLKAYDAVMSMYDLAYLQYSFDVTDETLKNNQLTIDAEAKGLDAKLSALSFALLNASDEARARLIEIYGEAYPAYVERTASIKSDAVLDLRRADSELVTRYDALASSLTVPYNGRDWTFEEILDVRNGLDYETYYRLYRDYIQQFNAEAGEIYLELVAIRSEIAETLGYGNYAAYGYDYYARDYTLSDSRALHAAVKKYLVPIYLSIDESSDESVALYYLHMDEAQFIERFRAAMRDFAPDLWETSDFLLRNHLYDTSVSPKKMEGSFTTHIGGYSAPFLFTQWDNSQAVASTFIHEFGHFSNFYYMGGDTWGVSSSLDLAEIDSQGLELLASPYYPQFYGELADAAVRARLTDALYAIISGCMEDEFQQEVYRNPDMTLDDINALYGRLCGEYGFSELYGYTGTEWAMIPHTFQSPMYYISYAVSMLAATELYDLLQTDPDAAKTAYLSILHREKSATFSETLREVGIADPFSTFTIRRIADLLEEKLLSGRSVFSHAAAA